MYKMFSHLLLVALCFIVENPKSCAAPLGKQTQIDKVITSPDGEISLSFKLVDGKPFYSALFKRSTAILPSALGFELKEGSMKTGFHLLDFKKSSKDESWVQAWGEQTKIRNHYNQLTVSLGEVGGGERRMNITFRAFDHAIAFRYEFPEQP